jgi:hypothetical protein
MLQPDDINVGDWIAVREAPNTAFDNIRGVALLVKAVDLPFVVCRFFSHPLTEARCPVERLVGSPNSLGQP